MTFLLWLVIVVALAVLITTVAVEETRVAEAHRETDSWRARTCTHGATTFRPYDGDGDTR